LEDGSEIRLNEKTLVSIDFCTINASTQDGKSVIRRLTEIFLDSGEVWCKGTVDSYIRTSSADIGRTSGIYRMSVGKDSSTVAKSYSGSVKIMHVSVSDAYIENLWDHEDSIKKVGDVEEPEYWSKELSPFKMLIISSKGEVIYFGEFDPDSIEEKTDWIEWNKKRDNIR
jgi:hypothetical protein